LVSSADVPLPSHSGQPGFFAVTLEVGQPWHASQVSSLDRESAGLTLTSEAEVSQSGQPGQQSSQQPQQLVQDEGKMPSLPSLA
jgi:hypothetical protein